MDVEVVRGCSSGTVDKEFRVVPQEESGEIGIVNAKKTKTKGAFRRSVEQAVGVFAALFFRNNVWEPAAWSLSGFFLEELCGQCVDVLRATSVGHEMDLLLWKVVEQVRLPRCHVSLCAKPLGETVPEELE